MKILLLSLTWITLFAFNFNKAPVTHTDMRSFVLQSKPTEAEQVRNEVLAFIAWYKKSIGTASKIPLVNQKKRRNTLLC